MPNQTNTLHAPSRTCRRRRGTTTVEFAIVALPLFMFIFAGIEFGRAMMAMQSLEESARMGCRRAILDGSVDSEIEAAVDEVLAGNGIKVYSVEVDPVALDSLDRWEPVTVRVSTTFDEITWLPAPIYFKEMSYTASCTLPREGQADD